MTDIHKQLFDHFANEHDLILLDSQIHDIINIVRGRQGTEPANEYGKVPCEKCGRKFVPRLIKPLTICGSCSAALAKAMGRW